MHRNSDKAGSDMCEEAKGRTSKRLISSTEMLGECAAFFLLFTFYYKRIHCR